MFKCYICGKEYESPVEAAKCTLECQEMENEYQEKLTELDNSVHCAYERLNESIAKYNQLNHNDKYVCVLKRESKSDNKSKAKVKPESKHTDKDTSNFKDGDTYTLYDFIRDITGFEE